MLSFLIVRLKIRKILRDQSARFFQASSMRMKSQAAFTTSVEVSPPQGMASHNTRFASFHGQRSQVQCQIMQWIGRYPGAALQATESAGLQFLAQAATRFPIHFRYVKQNHAPFAIPSAVPARFRISAHPTCCQTFFGETDYALAGCFIPPRFNEGFSFQSLDLPEQSVAIRPGFK